MFSLEVKELLILCKSNVILLAGELDRGVQYSVDEHDGSDARVRQVPSMSDMLICYPTQEGTCTWDTTFVPDQQGFNLSPTHRGDFKVSQDRFK